MLVVASLSLGARLMNSFQALMAPLCTPRTPQPYIRFYSLLLASIGFCWLLLPSFTFRWLLLVVVNFLVASSDFPGLLANVEANLQ